jgi:hypothetical protein
MSTGIPRVFPPSDLDKAEPDALGLSNGSIVRLAALLSMMCFLMGLATGIYFFG